MTRFNLLISFVVSLAFLAFCAHSQSLNEGFARNSQDVLQRLLNDIVVGKNLKTNSDLLNENQVPQALKKNSNELLKGNKQRSYLYTPTGTVNLGFKMTPLDDYVSRPDNHYQWQELATYYDDGAYDVHFLNVTSQQWLDEKTVSRSIWWHIVAVIRPTNFTSTNYGVTYITGTGNSDTIPALRDESILLGSALAVETQTIAVVIWQIPNQRLFFYDEKPTPKSRSEDGIIAYTWDHFLKNPKDSDWLLRNPMVKGSNRALDAVEDYVQKKWNHVIEKWTICGASKRGWTSKYCFYFLNENYLITNIIINL